MIAIRMRFLAGRFHSTPWGHHVNEGVVEYPPSLWRLLRSLIATARRAFMGEITEEQLRRIVSALAAPPEFCLPRASIAHTRHYDQDNDGVKFFDTFVSLMPQDEVLWFWPDAEISEEERATLAKLLAALGTFGRAESWCEAELLSEEKSQQAISRIIINSKPLDEGATIFEADTIRLLMPQPTLTSDELMKVLETETSVMRKNKQLEPTGTRWITYTRPIGILSPRRSQQHRLPGKTKQVTIARYALDSTVLPLVQDSLSFAELVRRALIRARVDTSHSEAITGKTSNGQPLEGHMHAHYFATDEYTDGRIDHITIYAPGGFDSDDIAALGQLTCIFRHGNRPDVRMILTGLGASERFPDAPLFAASRRWRSVTPFSLPRFSSRGAGKPPRPRDMPQAQLARELESRRLPAPLSINRIEGYSTGDRPLVRWLDFHSRRFNGSEGHGLAGFEIEFNEFVRGPISLGFACHFGLGLFMPF